MAEYIARKDWVIQRSEPLWVILQTVTWPLQAVIHSLPVAPPRIWIAHGINNIQAASLQLGEEREWRFLGDAQRYVLPPGEGA